MSSSTISAADTFSPRFYARWLLALLAAVGLALCVVLTGMSLPSPDGDASASMASRLCTPGARVNCDYVLASDWGKIAGIPTAMLGSAYFAALLAWLAVVGLPNRGGRSWHAVPLALTAAGLLASLGFMFVMATRLPVWCTWCVAVHAVNVLMFAGVLLTWPRTRAAGPASEAPLPVAEPPQPSTARAATMLTACAGVMLCGLLGGIGLINQIKAVHFHRQWLDATNNAEYIQWRHQSAPRHDIPVSESDASMGEPYAPDVLVVFSDFECAGCRDFHMNAAAIASQFPGTIRIVFKHFPMDSACNPSIEGRFHAYACEAAKAAAAATDAGTADQARAYAHLLFENAAKLPSRPYPRLAREAGIDADAFEKAMAGGSAAARVREDIELGKSIGVSATPAMFLDGRALSSWRIVTNEVHMRGDPMASLELWERLLATPARNKPKD